MTDKQTADHVADANKMVADTSAYPPQQAGQSDGGVTVEQARIALDNMDDYSRMGGIVPSGAFQVLRKFIAQRAAPPSPQGEPSHKIYDATTVAALRAEIERLRATIKEALK